MVEGSFPEEVKEGREVRSGEMDKGEGAPWAVKDLRFLGGLVRRR